MISLRPMYILYSYMEPLRQLLPNLVSDSRKSPGTKFRERRLWNRKVMKEAVEDQQMMSQKARHAMDCLTDGPA